MDPKFLEELQKLKEEKNADLDKIDLGQLSMPDFDDVDVPEDTMGKEAEEEIAGGTIKFQPVTPERDEPKPSVPGGRRSKKPAKPVIDEATRKKRAKIRNAVLISCASVIAVVAIVLTAFFGIRNANMKNISYPYWGMGIGIENGVETYSFFGNLKEITQYGVLGETSALAEFEQGNCIKETAFTSEGNVDYYYTHEYVEGVRISSSYYKDGQVLKTAKYTLSEEGRILTEITYPAEENRVETLVLTLSDDGNVAFAEYYTEQKLTHKDTYSGVMITETVRFDDSSEITSRTVYEYNQAKQLLTQTEYDGKNAIVGRTVNQYNDKNLMTKTIQYDGDGAILEYTTYNYDLNNNPIKQVSYNPDGTMKAQLLKVFDEENRVTKETSLQADGSIVYCYGYQYDGKGYISKSIVYNVENSNVIDEYTLFQRNDAGMVLESKIHNSADVLIEKSVYNNAGFLTELYKFTDSGVLTLEQKATYDEKQRLTQKSVTEFSEKGDKLTHQSEQYDEKGFVTVRIDEDTKANKYEHYLYAYQDDWKKEETLFDKSGKPVHEKTFDQKQRVVAETLYENGKDVLFNEYSYNNNDQIVQKRSMDLLTEFFTKTVYSYDKNGQLVSTLDSDIQNTPLTQKDYDEDGLVIKQTNFGEDGSILLYYVFEYDQLDRVIIRETFGADNALMEKTVYYYRTDGGYDYTIYDGTGTAVEDSRGPEYLPDTDGETTDSETSDETSDTQTQDTPSDTNE